MSASHQSICKALAPAPQSFILQILFFLKSSMYDQEQQFTVFSWLNKNIRGIQVVPSEPDSLDWCRLERMWDHWRINVRYMILAEGRPFEYHQFGIFFSRKYLNVFTQLDIPFQLDLFSSCFQVIYKCVSLCFFLYAFYFPNFAF